jgi:hypothetical protein
VAIVPGVEDQNPKRGRGRPRKDRHFSDYRELGAPPCSDLLDLAEWSHRVVALTAFQVHHGRGTPEIRAALRTLATALAKLLPAGLAAQALNLIDASQIDPEQPPPDEDPLKRTVWLTRVIAAEMWRVIMEDGSNGKRREELCAAARAMVAILPPDAYYKAKMTVLRRRKDKTGVYDRGRAEAAPLPAAASASINLRVDG